MSRTSTLERPPQHKRQKRGADAVQTPMEKIRGKAMDTSGMANAALVSADKSLTSQQLAFAQAWARGESISSASLRAGYSQDSIGYRLVKMPNVLKAYHAEKVLYETASQMTRKRVMDGLLEAVEMAKLMAEPASMVSGWREIGKMCGYYEPTKIQVDVNVSGEVSVRQLNAMTDAELLKLIKGPTA